MIIRKIGLSLLFLLTSLSVNAGTMTFNPSGLEDLGPNAIYEGWIIVNGNAITTGTFTVDGAGVPSQTDFPIADADAAAATVYVLTIEPVPDPDPGPADTHILAGSFNMGVTSATVGHPAALGDDFSGASGSFILAVPSDSNAVGSYRNGIWWLAMPGPTPGLVLPTLPAGWVYEGWVVDTNLGVPVSTGTFASASGADSDGAGPTAGPGGSPPFPGQDFLNPLVDLTVSHAAVISIEPVPDNSPGPFTLKPLVTGAIADTGGPGISQPMSNNSSGNNPTAQVTLSSGTAPVPGATQPIPTLGFYSILFLLLATVLLARRQLVGAKPE